jgi:hypothetical protein
MGFLAGIRNLSPDPFPSLRAEGETFNWRFGALAPAHQTSGTGHHPKDTD